MELQALLLGKDIRASAGGKDREGRHHPRGNADAFCVPRLLQRRVGLSSAHCRWVWGTQAGHSLAVAVS